VRPPRRFSSSGTPQRGVARLTKEILALEREGSASVVAAVIQKHRIAGLDAVADELLRRKDEVEEEEAEAVLEALRAVLAELEGAFEG
jgi:hypothetical protein